MLAWVIDSEDLRGVLMGGVDLGDVAFDCVFTYTSQSLPQF